MGTATLTHKCVATDVDTVRNVKSVDVSSCRAFMVPKLNNMSVRLELSGIFSESIWMCHGNDLLVG